jgi:hypothetical protein
VNRVSSFTVTAPSQFKVWVLSLVVSASVACANHSEQLSRAETHFQQNRYRAALSNLQDLEMHRYVLSPSERVRYDIARGMAHLRLDEPSEARYWLALAREEAAAEPTALTRSMREEIDRVLLLTDPLARAPRADGGTSTTEAR